MNAISTGYSTGAGQLAVVLFPLLVVLAGAGDVLTRRIPNRLVLATAVSFFPLALFTGMPAWLLGLHVLTAFAFLAVGYCLFLFGFLGGGDAKLMAAAALWLGYPCSLLFVGFCLLAGGVLAAAVGLWSLARLEGTVHGGRLGRLFGPLAPSVPYGFAIAAGAILATPFSWWMRVAMA